MTLFNYLRLILVTIIFGLSSYQFSWAAQADFSWLPNDKSDGTAGYILHYGKSPRNYTESVDVGSPAPVNGRIYASVSTLEAEQTYFFTVTAYNAEGNESPYPNEVKCTTLSSVIPEFALRINAGGGEYVDSNGDVWSADFGYNTGNKSSTPATIGGTVDDVLFQSQRWDDKAGEELNYSFDIPDGDYVVNLYFAEVYSGVLYPGGRQFDILFNGSTVEYKFDIYDEVGWNTAYMKSYEVTVVGGQLNIKFIHGIENPTISAIEIISFAVKDPESESASKDNEAGFGLRVNAGGGAYTDSNGDVWSADFGFNTGNKSSSSVAINGTHDDALFQTQRWDANWGEELKYSFDVPNGNYVVNLYFAEVYTGAFRQGARVFDILLEGYNVDRNFDIYSAAGANAAHMRSYEVGVVDGELNMEFLHGVENPTISAIEVFSY